MAAHRYIDRLCAAVLALTLAVAALFTAGEALGLQAAGGALGYEARLFDTGRVHTLEIIMDDWEGFLDTCENEEYQTCELVIDGEACQNVAIRAKGNTSLTSVAAYGNDRYSFKVEFDHYDEANTYYGLDKLNLNNLIQDNTCMKDYLVYRLMAAFGVSAPLCSYVSVTVNGQSWGLYLAVEGVEDAFLRRNYGSDAGALYKPDSVGIGGGRGNGGNFRMEALDFPRPEEDASMEAGGLPPAMPQGEEDFQPPEGFPQVGQDPGNMEPDGGGFGGMGSSDVKLQYIDGDPDSYANIFDNAKTEITQADKARLIASLQRLGEGDPGVVDVEQVMRYFVVHGFVCNGDSYTGSMIHNYYLYEKDGVLSMLPWDYNLAFGGFQSSSATSTVNEPIDTPVTGSLDDRPMLSWIFADEEYTALYHQYYDEFVTQYLESGWCARLIEETAELIDPYVSSDPTKFCTYQEFQAGVSALETFCALRARSVRGQLEGTIPSTAQAQAAQPASLVDASGLTIADMGSMGQGGGPGGGDFRLPEDFDGDRQAAFAAGEGGQKPPGGETGTDSDGGFRPPGGGEGPAGSDGGEAGLLAGSLLLLAAGLAFAALFRRRGR